MPQFFISYSRVDREFVKRLAERIQLAFPDLTLWRDDVPHGLIGGDNWWDAILSAIAESDVFVYVLSNESIQSVYCQAEFTEARRLQKRIITIQARDKTELTDDLDDIQFIDMKYGPDDPDAFPRLVAASNKQLALVKNKRPLWKPATPKPRKEPPPTRTANSPTVETPPLVRPSAEAEALRLTRSGVRWQIIGVVLSGVLGLAALALPLLDRSNAGALMTVVEASLPPSETQPPSAMTEMPTRTVTNATTPTFSNFEQLQTAQMQLTRSAGTQVAADFMATQENMLSANATATAQQIAATESVAHAILVALSWTATPRPTGTLMPPTAILTATLTLSDTSASLQTALNAAYTFTGSNADWQALYPDGFQHTFDNGVPMVLVPVGGFTIGANSQQDDERNGNWIQFATPFWIDLNEVTQADFTRLGGVKANANGFPRGQRPVERITWFEASDFCALRGGWLPTESEWEYAARGPSEWDYPWGNTWNANNAVWNRSASQGTEIVGIISTGRSWVGAFDMSGNIWEWVNSLYIYYPYNENRESSINADNQYVLRGGSWAITQSVNLRAGLRFGDIPNRAYYVYGFRCARFS